MWEYKFFFFWLDERREDDPLTILDVLPKEEGYSPIEEAQEQLNGEGADGWEVITVLPKIGKDERAFLALMKRPKT